MTNYCAKHDRQIKQQLKALSLKTTKARLKILDLFSHDQKPKTAAEVYKAVKNGGTNLATIYRNLEDLEKLGMFKSISINQMRYFEPKGQHHHHIVCQSCGKVADIAGCPNIVIGRSVIRGSGFAQVFNHEMEFFGLCLACQK